MDYKDFLRQRGLRLWPKDHPRSRSTRALCYRQDRSYSTYRPYIENAPPEVAANTAVCVLHQTNFLLDRQLRTLESDFVEEGGFTERLYRTRTEARRKKRFD